MKRSRALAKKDSWSGRWVLFFSFLLLGSLQLAAQGSSKLTIYDEEGVPFEYRLDGERSDKQEETTRISIDSIAPGSHEILIAFPDTSIPPLEKAFDLEARVSYTFALRSRGANEGREWSLISRVESEEGEGGKTEQAEQSPVSGGSLTDKKKLPRVDSNFIRSYRGASSCSNPIGNELFRSIHRSVQEAVFEKERIRMAKKKIAEHCVISAQVAALMRTLNYDDNRLDLAKYAYERTFDLANYDRVRSALNFEASREKLDGYLKEVRQ